MNREPNLQAELNTDKDPEQIEREIDAQRASIGNIVDALESKFTPGQMFDQALGMMQSNGTTFLTNLGTSVRNNPVPAVLTSVGLLWLMMSQNRPPQPQTGYRSGPDQNRFGEWADGLADGIDSARGHLHDTADSVSGGYQSLKDRAASMGDRVGAASQNMGDRLSAASHNMGDAMHHASDSVVQNTQALGQQFNRMLKEQPLVVAAAGIALGALLGAAFPTTSTERRYLGGASAGMVDKVKKQAQEGYETVRDTVTQTTEHQSEPGASRPGTPGQSGSSGTSGNSADLSEGLGTS
jgi:ElaB/YqjD/DUF883 family membrane-anchored ribosome-binding protein